MTNATKSIARPQKTIGFEISFFVDQIDALADTLPMANVAIVKVLKESHESLQTFLDTECKPRTDPNNPSIKNYTLDGDQYLKFQRVTKRLYKAGLAHTLVPRGLLVAMVSQFDAYVGKLIRHLLDVQPAIINCCDRQFTFSELTQFSSLDAVREHVVEKEVEAVLRESHSTQFEWLRKKFGIPLTKDLPSWPKFVEVTERRNLFVHTNGVVSSQYVDVCRKHGFEIPNGVRVGTQLPLDSEYFREAAECVLEIGIKLGQVLWRKVVPSELAFADQNLNKITYTLLSEERYELARTILDFATETLPRHTSEDYRLRCVINRAQAYKWQGKSDKCKEILEQEDWSATGLEFKLAHAILCDDEPKAISIFKQMGARSNLDKHTYREWPIFKELRKSAEFAAAFFEVFGEPLAKVAVSQDNTGSPNKNIN